MQGAFFTPCPGTSTGKRRDRHGDADGSDSDTSDLAKRPNNRSPGVVALTDQLARASDLIREKDEKIKQLEA